MLVTLGDAAGADKFRINDSGDVEVFAIDSNGDIDVVGTIAGHIIGTDILAEQTIGITDNDLLEVDGSPNSAEYARFTAAGLEGRTEAEFKADFNLQIGTDVLAETAIGISNDNLLSAKNTAVSTEYARFTAAGLESRSEAEFKADYNLEAGTDFHAFDTVLDEISGLGTVADNEVIIGTGAGTYAHETGATLHTSLGLAIGANVQAFGAVLDDLNTLGIVGADSEFLVGTASGVLAWEAAATALISIGAQGLDLVLTDLAALDEVLIGEFMVGTGTGAYTHQKISAITEETAPVPGDWLLGEEAGGLVRRFDIKHLVGLLRESTKTADYTLVLADAGSTILMNGTGSNDNDVLIPLNSSVAFPVGTVIHVAQTNTEQTTIVEVSTVLINSPVVTTPTNPKLRARYSMVTLLKTATDTWLVTGDLDVS